MPSLKEIRKADFELSKINQEIEADIVKYINPTNSLEEREKFFEALERGNEYNPKFNYLQRNPLFVYFESNPHFEEIKKRLASIKTDESIVGRIFEMRKILILKKIELIQSIGTEMLTEYSLRLYGKPKEKEKEFARKWIKLEAKQIEKTITAKEAAEYLQRFLSELKLFDWKVNLDENLSSDALINPAQKEIKIRSNAMFSKEQLKRLKVHEIQSHAFRYLNGMHQELKILATGISEESEKIDEGLAVMNELIFGLLTNEQKKIYAARLLAADYALKHSFYETFNYLAKYLDQETAYKISQRVKRGLVDSSNQGAFTKDLIYLRGFLEVKKYLEEGGRLEDLYIGKVSIEELKVIPILCKIRKPKFLPDYPKVLIDRFKYELT